MQRQVFVKNEEIIPRERFNQNPLPGYGRMMVVIKSTKMFRGKMEGMCFKLRHRSHLYSSKEVWRKHCNHPHEHLF